KLYCNEWYPAADQLVFVFMASLSEAEEALRSTKQKSNFQRLTRLLMRGGAVLLREVFDSIHSPANLPTTLSDPSVKGQLRRARLTSPEWNCLSPSPGVYGKSSDFDISLIFKLLRTICNLTTPPTGWDSLPNDFDHSLEADLARIKYYRNEVYGHSNNLEIPDEQFLDLWGKISEALLRIAAHLCPEKQNNWKDAMEKFLRDPLTPEEERYAEELELWYQKDIDNTKVLRELVQEVRELREDTRDQQDGHLSGSRPSGKCESNRRAFSGVSYESKQQNLIEKRKNLGKIESNKRGMQSKSLRNQQEIPAEVDLWNVIVAFEHPFRLLFGYLGNTLSAFIEDIELGSLSITVKCSSLQILEGLWEDYVSGHLNQVVQETLVTNEVLENLGLDDVKLKVFISEEEYRNGKRILTAENSAFEHPFRLLFGYLGNTLSAFIEDIELGSLSITVKCSSLQILEGLWEDYVSGHLNQVVQETLVTNEVLENLGLDDVKLKVFISEEEY
ncbi:unnamed protein product, partial [Porites evermanni]